MNAWQIAAIKAAIGVHEDEIARLKLQYAATPLGTLRVTIRHKESVILRLKEGL